MREPNTETVNNISSTKIIAGRKMASGLSAKAKEPTDLEPQYVSDKKYRVEVESDFRCQETGIKFEVTSPTIIEYSLEYGRDYMTLIQENKYELLGPIFNVQVKSGRVSAVYLPHYVCLEGFRGDKSMIKFGHFKDGKVTLKTPSRLEPSYVVLENPTFSCVAAVGGHSVWRRRPYPFNGQVLVYFRVVCAEDDDFMEYRIHLYLIPTDRPHLGKLNEMKRVDGFKRIDKPALTSNVYTNINYIINGKPRPDIYPQTLQFTVHKEIENCPYTEINISKDKEQISLYVETEREESSPSEPVWRGRLTRADIKELSAQAARTGVSPKQFVDEHRSDLIQKVINIMPVLDDLKKKGLLTQENYNNVTSKSTSQDKMRELLMYVQQWSPEDKNTFYEVVKKHNKPIIKEIEKEN